MRDRSRLEQHARSFGQAADVYAASRPGYPQDAVDWLVPSDARTVLDLGAGTGKLTTLLARSGREVIAVDPSADMLARLTASAPDVEVHVGTAESIPLPDASVDAVTVAQAWHWVDAARAVPEVARVLRPGGTLGLVWNTRDESVDWVAQLGEIMGGTAHYEMADDAPPVGSPFTPLESSTTRWLQPLAPAAVLDLVRSRSYFLVRTAGEQDATLAAVQDLLDSHPDLAGRVTIELPYVTECFRARLGADRPVR
ncbi:SAM-dependent methyltransferase [Mycetocola sp. CAN_C7]|uniref:class I SAM-dependent methyltransferase n=1 Tax=Mycetocola sp. CAN_C7 TaxID=2787724 RepID=UPI0018C97165